MMGWLTVGVLQEPAEYTYVNPADWDVGEQAPETKEGFNWGYEEGMFRSSGWILVYGLVVLVHGPKY